MDIKLNLKILKLFINNTVKQSERWILGQPLVKGFCTTILISTSTLAPLLSAPANHNLHVIIISGQAFLNIQTLN